MWTTGISRYGWWDYRKQYSKYERWCSASWKPSWDRNPVAEELPRVKGRNPLACRECGEVTSPPHWGNECPMKKSTTGGVRRKSIDPEIKVKADKKQRTRQTAESSSVLYPPGLRPWADSKCQMGIGTLWHEGSTEMPKVSAMARP